ncbi:MAG: carbohydrate ABC transporter substrate-binding protein [Clostridia bacterium]|nr:carbohydrate ABC transporter substrate-binding protein [Clostridia bacterium]
MKKLSILLVTALLFLSLTGCCQRGGVETGSTVRLLNFKPEIASVYESIAKAYENETGVRLIVETAAANTYESTLTAKMATNEAPTIFQINGPRGYANWKDYCKNLEDSRIADIVTDEDLLLSTDEGVFGIPYVVEGYGIIYNDAIMRKFFALPDKKTQISSAQEITSFDSLKEVVEEMTQRKADLGIEGVFASTSLKPGEDWRWQTHLMNIPVHYEFSKNDINLETDEVANFNFEFAENYKKLFDLYLNNSVTDKKMLGAKITGDSMAEFALGKCAMVQNGNWGYSQIKEVGGNTVSAEDVKMMPIYMGIDDEDQGLCIGTEGYLSINKRADEAAQQAAEDFLYWLFSSETGKKYVTEGLGFITPFNTFSNDETPDDPLAREVVRWMNMEGVDTIPWDFVIFPSQVFKNNLGSNLLQYAQGTKDWSTVRDETVKDWKAESNR